MEKGGKFLEPTHLNMAEQGSMGTRFVHQTVGKALVPGTRVGTMGRSSYMDHAGVSSPVLEGIPDKAWESPVIMEEVRSQGGHELGFYGVLRGGCGESTVHWTNGRKFIYKGENYSVHSRTSKRF